MKEIKVSKNAIDHPEPGEYAGKEEVSIIAVQRTYKTRPYYATPIYNNDLNDHVFGLVKVPEEVKRKCSFKIEKNINYLVENNQKLTLYKDDKGAYIVNRDFLLYNMFLTLPEIANSKDEVRKGTTLFYLHNAEQIAIDTVAKYKLVGKATFLLGESTIKDWSDMLYFLNMNPFNYSANIIEGKVYQTANDEPEKVIEFFEKRSQSDQVVFVNKLLANGLITKDRNGYIMYDKVSIGHDAISATHFLYDKQNDKIFSALKGSLDAKEGIKN
jgi:hypothetical protein